MTYYPDRFGIGGNNPPLQTISERLYADHRALRELVAAMGARADGVPRTPIKSQTDFDIVGTLIKDASALAKKADATRVAEKDPYLAGGR